MILDYRPGNAFFLVGGLALFVVLVLFAQYQMNGSLNLRALVDTPADPFWARTPELERVDSFPRTSLAMFRNRKSGAAGMLDLAVVNNSEVKTRACDNVPATYPGAANTMCLDIGDTWRAGASFTANAKDSEVAGFYRRLFQSRGLKVTAIENSSRAIILEAEDARHNTVVRVSLRGSFDTVDGFLAWTNDFQTTAPP